jgi:uncharacterized protein YyaL (SSP411 family)
MASSFMQRSPTAAGQMLIALDRHFGPTPEIVILGDPADPETTAILADLRKRYIPNYVLACRADASTADSDALRPLFEGKTASGPEPQVFICENFTCQAPLHGRDAIIAAWTKLAAPQ